MRAIIAGALVALFLHQTRLLDAPWPVSAYPMLALGSVIAGLLIASVLEVLWMDRL